MFKMKSFFREENILVYKSLSNISNIISHQYLLSQKVALLIFPFTKYYKVNNYSNTAFTFLLQKLYMFKIFK